MPFEAYLTAGFQHRHENEMFAALVAKLMARFASDPAPHVLIGNIMFDGNDLYALFLKPDGICIAEMKSHGGKVNFTESKTWTPVGKIAIQHCTSRFFLRRLRSGALLLVKHGGIQEKAKREKLMAFISDDDGKTWQGGLMLDERDDVTYPDDVQAKDGTIYLIYDHQRTPLGEVLMATFREEDVRAAKIISTEGSLKQVIDRLSGP